MNTQAGRKSKARLYLVYTFLTVLAVTALYYNYTRHLDRIAADTIENKTTGVKTRVTGIEQSVLSLPVCSTPARLPRPTRSLFEYPSK